MESKIVKQVKSGREGESERVKEDMEDEFPLMKAGENIILQSLQQIEDRCIGLWVIKARSGDGLPYI